MTSLSHRLTWCIRSHLQRSACRLSPKSEKSGMFLTERCLSSKSKYHGFWEPELNLEPDIPEFPVIQVKMRGYDYPVLEAYARRVHQSLAQVAEMDTDAFASPAKNLEVRTYHPRSTNVNEKYHLNKYERTITAVDVPGPALQLIVPFLRQHCPQGVEVEVKEPDADEDEARFVPDYDLRDLQAQRTLLEAGSVKGKKKK